MSIARMSKRIERLLLDRRVARLKVGRSAQPRKALSRHRADALVVVGAEHDPDRACAIERALIASAAWSPKLANRLVACSGPFAEEGPDYFYAAIRYRR